MDETGHLADMQATCIAVQRPDSDTENINVNNSLVNAKTTNTAFPVVYISYDQADVDKCKLLKDHLTSAGIYQSRVLQILYIIFV